MPLGRCLTRIFVPPIFSKCGHEQLEIDIVELGQDTPLKFPPAIIVQDFGNIVPVERHVIVIGKDRVDIGKRIVQSQQDRSDFIFSGLIDIAL